MANKELPIGIQNFREVCESGYYVDKTAFAKLLIDKGKHNFLSRPRRFGKSLFVDTLKKLFEGKKKLFEGLYIYDKWDWAVEYPVLRFSFGGGNFNEPGELQKSIMDQLAAMERREGLTTEAETASGRFAELIERLTEEKGQRVVILVDEYDKPILDAIGTKKLAEANRDTLRGFYATIKDCEENIRFSFLTGVSKFARAGIFSGLNNLRDITLKPEFSSICGYTENDLDTVFATEIKEFDREKIKTWYNGYNWRGKENVYNPFSILLLLDEREFGSWWFHTGTPTFLIEMLKKQRGGLGTLGLDGMSAGESLLSAFDIGNMKVPALLFQTGYLTIARVEEDEEEEGGKRYILDYPNFEVRRSLHSWLLDALTEGDGADKISGNIRKALYKRDAEAMKAGVHALLAGLANDVYRNNDLANLEGHYASVIYACFAETRRDVHAEDPTNHGAIDMTVETDTAIYVFEFKVLKGNTKRGAALKQIRERRYADKFLDRGVPVYLVGMEFDPEDRNIKYLDIEPIRGRRTSTRKKSGRKKSGRKKVTRKKSTRKKSSRKKVTRKKRRSRR